MGWTFFVQKLLQDMLHPGLLLAWSMGQCQNQASNGYGHSGRVVASYTSFEWVEVRHILFSLPRLFASLLPISFIPFSTFSSPLTSPSDIPIWLHCWPFVSFLWIFSPLGPRFPSYTASAQRSFCCHWNELCTPQRMSYILRGLQSLLVAPNAFRRLGVQTSPANLSVAISSISTVWTWSRLQGLNLRLVCSIIPPSVLLIYVS